VGETHGKGSIIADPEGVGHFFPLLSNPFGAGSFLVAHLPAGYTCG